jgi:mRNA interferase MazF
MYTKNFDGWNEIKKYIQSEKRKVYFRSGEIRWCSIGVNIGSEIDGKGNSYTRPVLILHVIGPLLALVIPLTTKNKKIPGYYNFDFQGKIMTLCINHIKIISSKRLLRRRGKIPKKIIEIKKWVKDFYLLG